MTRNPNLRSQISDLSLKFEILNLKSQFKTASLIRPVRGVKNQLRLMSIVKSRSAFNCCSSIAKCLDDFIRKHSERTRPVVVTYSCC